MLSASVGVHQDSVQGIYLNKLIMLLLLTSPIFSFFSAPSVFSLDWLLINVHFLCTHTHHKFFVFLHFIVFNPVYLFNQLLIHVITIITVHKNDKVFRLLQNINMYKYLYLNTRRQKPKMLVWPHVHLMKQRIPTTKKRSRKQ